MPALGELIDLRRYPIDDSQGAGQRLIDECRLTLDGDALCLLPGFVREDVLSRMREEVLSSRDHAYRIESERTPYSWLDKSAYADDHPIHIRSPHRLASITRDCLSPHSLLEQLYLKDEVTGFTREVLGFASLYRVVCPFLSLNVKVMGTDSLHGWHFDHNDGAISLLLQAPKAGGHFEYVPYIRSAEDENHEEIRTIIQGDRSKVVRVDIAPGTFCIFKGHRSLHRVSPVVSGDPDRLIAIFSYSGHANHRYNQRTITAVLGRLPPGGELAPVG